MTVLTASHYTERYSIPPIRPTGDHANRFSDIPGNHPIFPKLKRLFTSSATGLGDPNPPLRTLSAEEKAEAEAEMAALMSVYDEIDKYGGTCRLSDNT